MILLIYFGILLVNIWRVFISLWEILLLFSWEILLLLFSHQVMSDSLWPHGLQDARFPCPLPSPRVFPSSCLLLSDTIQPSHPLSPSFPSAFNLSQHQGLFQWVAFFATHGQSIGASASASVLLMNIYGCFPLGLTGRISLLSKGLPRVFSSTAIKKHQFFGVQPSLWSSSHIHVWLLEEP